MATPLPITTDCYAERLSELRGQLQRLQQQSRQGGWSEELEDLMQQQIRALHASLWALQAELEQE